MNKNKVKTGAEPKTKKAVAKNKKLLIISAILGAVVLLGGMATAVIFVCNGSQQEQPKETVILNDNLEFEINSEVKISALVGEDNTVSVLNESEAINTSSLGEQEVVIRYEVDGSEETATATITIIDTKPPVIEYQKELTTTVGVEIDLLKDVKVTDNSKEEIKATIEGDYDFNKEGSYNLKYVATDKSGNKTEEAFTLTVNKKPTTTSSSSSSTMTKPSTAQNGATNGNNNLNSGHAFPEECEKGYKEAEPYMGKVFTSIPSGAHKGIEWSSSRLYVTAEKEGTITTYTMHNERISGRGLGDTYADQVDKLIGPLPEMRYTKEKPLIVYYSGVFSCAWIDQ